MRKNMVGDGILVESKKKKIVDALLLMKVVMTRKALFPQMIIVG